MRALQLARIAAEAEGLRLRHTAQRNGIRIVLGVGALGFVLGAIIFCHIAAWCWLIMSWDQSIAALIIAGADLVLAAVLALVTMRSSPRRVEAEALALRRQALDHVATSLTIPALAAQLLPFATRLLRRR
jgi:hypothetical protein